MSQPKPDIGSWRKPVTPQNPRLNPDDFVNKDPVTLREQLNSGMPAASDVLTIPVRIVTGSSTSKPVKVQANLRIRNDLYERMKTISKLTETPMGDIVDAALQEYLPKLIGRLPSELNI